MMSITEKLNRAFVGNLGGDVLWHSALEQKPLLVDLALPNPPRLRVYMYSLVGGVGTVRPNEYKIVLRVPGQAVGEYGSFDYSGQRVSLVVGYRDDLDVFVLWDASLQTRFKNGGNLQVRDTTVHQAIALGRSEQQRNLVTKKAIERVIACRSNGLKRAIYDRVASSGSEGWGRQ